MTGKGLKKVEIRCQELPRMQIDVLSCKTLGRHSGLCGVDSEGGVWLLGLG